MNKSLLNQLEEIIKQADAQEAEDLKVLPFTKPDDK